MSHLDLTPRIRDADGIYQKLIDLHEGRTDEDSRRINARLILILMNHIGDDAVIREALALAGQAPQTDRATPGLS